MYLITLKNLKRRRYSRNKLEPMFVSAHNKFTCPKPTNNESTEKEMISNKEQIILHLENHPNDVPKQKLREYGTTIAWICCQNQQVK